MKVTFRLIFMSLTEYATGAAAMALEKYDHPYIAPWVLIARYYVATVQAPDSKNPSRITTLPPSLPKGGAK